MKQRIWTLCAALLLGLLLAGCAQDAAQPRNPVPAEATDVTLTYYGGGAVRSEPVADPAALAAWFDGLVLVKQREAPEPVEGNESYEIAVDGAPVFSYDNRGDTAYLYLHADGIYYAVQNPSAPPFEAAARTFRATVCAVQEGSLLVEPAPDSAERRSADRMVIPLPAEPLSPLPACGDTVEIVYSGAILESYPAQLQDVSRVQVVRQAAEADGTPEAAPDEEVNSAPVSDWGISLAVEDITPTGLTLVISHTGGAATGSLEYGSDFSLDVRDGAAGGWTPVPPQVENFAWTAEAYLVPEAGSTAVPLSWEFLYGSLPAGTYRLSKPFLNVRAPGDYDTQTLSVEFTIP